MGLWGFRTLPFECGNAYPTTGCRNQRVSMPEVDQLNPLRVMSFNIRLGRAMDGRNRWYRRRNLVFDVLRRFSPHVMGLQEVSPFQLDELLEEFPAYGAIADKRYGGRWTGTYGPILFDTERLEASQSGDFWLSPEPDGGRSRGWDAAVPRICTWVVLTDRHDHGLRFVVFNAHFDQAGPEARVQSARLVASKLDHFAHIPRLVTLDLNADESTEPARFFGSAGYRDTFRVLHATEEAHTYHGFRGKGVRNLGKIDYILCDARWRVLAAAVVRDGCEGRFPSDHFPVTAELLFEAQKRR